METIAKLYTRNEASKLCGKLLNQNGLSKWHIRITTKVDAPLGMCDYNNKCIILNAHHIDTHSDVEVLDTINHEIAHALAGYEAGHNEKWIDIAKRLGCTSFSPCGNVSLSLEAINAIRSGADLEVTYEEEIVKKNIVVEETVIKPKYQVRKLESRCHVCDKIIKHTDVKEFVSQGKRYKKWSYECGHFYVQLAESQTLFENFITVAHRNNGCIHEWDKKDCLKCGANRPYQFQIDGMRAIERANGRLGVFDEQGLGKTIQSLGTVWSAPDKYTPTLYIVKSGTKYQWGAQILAWLGDDYIPQIFTSSKENFLPGLKSYIVSFNIWAKLTSEQVDRLFEHIGIKLIVIDECQQISNPNSTRTQMVRMLVKKVPYVLPLSGTPWKNRGSEFFVVLNMLDPKRFWSFEGFKKQWVEYYWDNGKQKEGGINNPAKFKEYIKDIVIRRERIEVMPELPVISRNKYIVDVPEHLRKAYQAEEDKLIKIYDEYAMTGEEDSFAAQKAYNASLMVMRQIIGVAKVPGTVEICQDFLEQVDRKLAVGIHHIEVGEMIYTQMKKWCSENGEPEPLRITSDMSSIERYEAQEKFNSKSHRFIILSTLAAGEGLNLQTCSDVVVHERQWNPANEEQLEGRFIRIGQLANAVTATYVHADNTCDVDLDSIVEGKRIRFHAAMNNSEMPAWNEGNAMKEFMMRLKQRRKK